MTSALPVILDALAAYRLTRLVTADTIAEPVRGAVVAYAYEREAGGVEPGDGETWTETAINDPTPPKLAELVTCRWCAGFWIAVLVVVARRVAPRAWRPVGEAFAFSALAALLARLED